MTEREKLEKIERRSGRERPMLTMREAAMFTGLSKNAIFVNINKKNEINL